MLVVILNNAVPLPLLPDLDTETQYNLLLVQVLHSLVPVRQ